MNLLCFDKCQELHYLSVEYQNILFEFEKKIEKSTNFDEQKEMLKKFGCEYTIIPEIWYQIISAFMEENEEEICEILKFSLLHFYSPYTFDMVSFKENNENELKRVIAFNKCYYYQKITDESLLTFPHTTLQEDYKNYVENFDHPISLKRITKYKKSKKMLKRLKRCAENKNYEKFMRLCFEFGDEKFAYQTIECRLSLNFQDKFLWIAYMNAVKHRNIKVMLNIYHRYTRLFLDDKEMKEKYENEKKNAEKRIEIYNSSLPDLEYYLFDELKKQKLEIPRKHFDKNTVKLQHFSLPKTFIFYILNLSNAKIRFKLFQSCKLLFFQNPTPICHKLVITNKNITGFRNDETNFDRLSNLFISNRFEFKYYSDLKMLTTSIIPKLYHCHAKFIKILQQIITFKDYKFLVSSLQVRKFEYSNGGIVYSFDDDDEMITVSVDDLLSFLPNAYEIRIKFNDMFKLFSTSTLSNLKQKTKIKYLELKHFNCLLNVEDYCKFIINNATKYTKVNLAFGTNVSMNDVTAFDKTVNGFTNEYFDKKKRRSLKRQFGRLINPQADEFKNVSSIGFLIEYTVANLTKFGLKPVKEM